MPSTVLPSTSIFWNRQPRMSLSPRASPHLMILASWMTDGSFPFFFAAAFAAFSITASESFARNATGAFVA